MLVTEIIRRGAVYHGDRIAIRFGDESRTFREVDRLSNRIANTLKDGLGRALAAEAVAGAAPLAEGARDGAARFAGGLGRSGGFEDI